MRSQPQRVAESVVKQRVSDGWGLRIEELRYFPEGGGAYHWIAYADDARRWFVTCDDLDTKPWLGYDRDSVFAGLRAAYGAAMDLRASGLKFVVAPVPAISGGPAERIDDRHTVSVFEHVDGEPQQWGRRLPPSVLGEVVTVLALLHQSASAVHTIAHRGLEVPGRDKLEAVLTDLHRPWDGGPLSEPARRELATHADLVARWLTHVDRVAVAFAGSAADTVVTHGEPHPGNLIRTGSGLALVDWDTVALARPERDLWMIVDAADDVVTAYQNLTGITLDREALFAYRLLWALTDVAAFTVQLRGEHRRDADADKALAALRTIFAGREPTPYGAHRR